MHIQWVTNETDWEETCAGICEDFASKLSEHSIRLDGILIQNAIKIDNYICIFRAVASDVKIIILKDALGNFVSIPRIFGVNDGYDSELKAIGNGQLDYPFEKEGKTTQTLAIDFDDNSTEVSRDGLLFGNIDWVGKRTTAEVEASDAPVLTWKGPTGRTIPFDYKVEISGLTTPDIKFSETSDEYYTCFGPNIYQSGDILATIPTRGDIPPKVLGCALQGDILVAVINNHYADKLGFFDEVWVLLGDDENKDLGGWKIIDSRAAGRPTQCWFFNQSGTKCTQGTVEYVLAKDLKSVSIVNYDDGIGAYSILGSIDEVLIKHTGNYALYSDYKDDERIQLSIKVSDLTKRTRTNSTTESFADLTTYAQGSKPVTTTTISIASITGVTVGSQFSIIGTIDPCCSISNIIWSITGGGTIDSTGKVLTAGCGTGVVSVNLGTGCTNPPALSFLWATGMWTFDAWSNLFIAWTITQSGIGSCPSGCATYCGSGTELFSSSSIGCDGYKANGFSSGYTNVTADIGIYRYIDTWRADYVGQGSFGRVSDCSDCALTRSYIIKPTAKTTDPGGYTVPTVTQQQRQKWIC